MCIIMTRDVKCMKWCSSNVHMKSREWSKSAMRWTYAPIVPQMKSLLMSTHRKKLNLLNMIGQMRGLNGKLFFVFFLKKNRSKSGLITLFKNPKRLKVRSSLLFWVRVGRETNSRVLGSSNPLHAIMGRSEICKSTIGRKGWTRN